MMIKEIQLGVNKYEIDEYGNVRKRRGEGFVKTFPDKDGYLKLALMSKKGTPTYNEPLHRAVYRAFVEEIPKGMSVDHIDNNKKNNHYSNLQLMSMEDNAIKGNAKQWIVTDPSGKEHEVYNLKRFCKENNLHGSHIVTHSYKKWRARVK